MHSNKPQVIQGNFIGGHPTFAMQPRQHFGGTVQRQPAPHVQAAIQQNIPHFQAVQRRKAAFAQKTAQHHAAQQPVVQRFGTGMAMQVPPGAVNLRFGPPGKPLPKEVQRKMETIFRADFSDVRIHVGPQAQQMGALAFAMGSDIYFAPGQYNPTTPHGQRLLGHELAHVVQQKTGRVRNPFNEGVAVVQDLGLEAEAQRMGVRVGIVQAQMALGRPQGVSPFSHAAHRTIQRMDTEKEAAKEYNWKCECGHEHAVTTTYSSSSPPPKPDYPCFMCGRPKTAWQLQGSSTFEKSAPPPPSTKTAIPTGSLVLPGNITNAPDFSLEIEQVGLEYIIGKKPTYTRANQVLITVRITIGGTVELEELLTTSDGAPQEPYISGPPHIHGLEYAQYVLSGGDAEATLLPLAEERCFGFLGGDAEAENPKEDPEIHHVVTLIGPFGPCEGCRQRMETFRRQWLELAQPSPNKQRLTLSYYYRNTYAIYSGTRTVDEEILQSGKYSKKGLPMEFQMYYGVRDEHFADYKPDRKNYTIFWYQTTAQNY